MTDFEIGGDVSVSITNQSLAQARKDIESLGGVEVDVAAQAAGGGSARTGGGVSSQLAGGGAAILEDSMNELVEFAQERNVMLSEMLEATEREAASGDGGGGGMGMGLLAMGGLTGGLSSLLGTVSLGALVTSVSAGTLIKAVPAAATLITGTVMAKNLIEGDVKASDIIDPLNNLGDLVTGPLSLPDYVETGVGLGVFIAGGVSIASFLTGTSITAVLSGASITSLLSGASLSSMLGGSVAASSLVSTSAAALVPAAAIVGGTVYANQLIEGEVYIHDYLKSGGSGAAGEGSGSTLAAMLGPGGEFPLPNEFSPQRVAPGDSAVGNDEELNQIQSNALENQGGNGSDQSSGSSSRGQSRGNSARERSRDTSIEYSPTINTDLKSLERKVLSTIQSLEQDIRELEKQIQDAGRN